jgi:hypothetical protein
MVEKGDLKALFRLFWNNINQQMIDDQSAKNQRNGYLLYRNVAILLVLAVFRVFYTVTFFKLVILQNFCATVQ